MSLLRLIVVILIVALVLIMLGVGINNVAEESRRKRDEARREKNLLFLSENDQKVKVVGIYATYHKGSVTGWKAVIEGSKTGARMEVGTHKYPVVGDIWLGDVDDRGCLFLKELQN